MTIKQAFNDLSTSTRTLFLFVFFVFILVIVFLIYDASTNDHNFKQSMKTLFS